MIKAARGIFGGVTSLAPPVPADASPSPAPSPSSAHKPAAKPATFSNARPRSRSSVTRTRMGTSDSEESDEFIEVIEKVHDKLDAYADALVDSEKEWTFGLKPELNDDKSPKKTWQKPDSDCKWIDEARYKYECVSKLVIHVEHHYEGIIYICLLYTSPSPRDS